jgi:hypothetical protein
MTMAAACEELGAEQLEVGLDFNCQPMTYSLHLAGGALSH